MLPHVSNPSKIFQEPQRFPDDQVPIGVYLHIPFCLRKCDYCGFVSHKSDPQLEIRYIDALIQEINNLECSQLVIESSFPAKFDTLYFGGGTPSVLGPEAFDRIIRAITGALCSSYHPEITIEVNPATYEKNQLGRLLEIGINRLSIGAQSLNDSELLLMSRHHSSQDFIRLFHEARMAGFDNISVDLLAGYPGQTLKTLMETVNGVVELEPDHVSVYLLELKTGSALESDVKKGRSGLLEDDLVADMYEAVCSKMEESGFRQYEISNFSHRDKESRHNMKYWSDSIFLGFGLAAHGMTGKIRYSNYIDMEKYIRAAKMGDSRIESLIRMNPVDRFRDAIIMGLRRVDGVDLELIGYDYGFDAYSSVKRSLSSIEHAGLYKIEKNILKLTNRGRLLSNVVFSHLI